MNIENVKSTEELSELLETARLHYNPERIDFDGDGLYSRKFWIEQFEKNPELLLYVKDSEKNKICAAAGGWADGGNVTIGMDFAVKGYENKGIHEALLIELEKRASKLGFKGVACGIEDGQEEFYAKLGYTGNMLIQSEKHTVGELLKHLEILDKKNYEIKGTNIYDGYIKQLWLNISILDKEIKKAYEEILGDCWTQIIVGKKL